MSALPDEERRFLLAEALTAAPGNLAAAARASGYSRMQVHRLVKDPELQRMVASALSRRPSSIPSFAAAAPPAETGPDVRGAMLAVLVSIAQDGEADDKNRIAAARAAHALSPSAPVVSAAAPAPVAAAPLTPEEATKRFRVVP